MHRVDSVGFIRKFALIVQLAVLVINIRRYSRDLVCAYACVLSWLFASDRRHFIFAFLYILKPVLYIAIPYYKSDKIRMIP